jgi:hypothetical protein
MAACRVEDLDDERRQRARTTLKKMTGRAQR